MARVPTGYGASSGPNTPSTTNTATMIAPTHTLTVTTAPAATRSCAPHPRVDQAVGDVDGDVDQHVDAAMTSTQPCTTG
jgi:hypothetical protein